jgi:O-antigen ligase
MIDKIIQLLFSLLFFATPLIMTKTTSELFEFNKMLFIYSSTILIVFFWLLKMINYKKIILKKTPLDIPIVIFFISQLISTVFSIDIHTSIFGYYGRFNGGLLSITCYIILYYAFISNFINVEKILKSIIASSLIVIVWAIPGHFGHDLTCLLFTGSFSNSCWDNTTLAFRPELRAFSTLGQPNWLGAYLAATFFIGIYYLIKTIRTNRYLILNTCYLILNFSMILMSRSRSAIGAVIVGLMLFVGYYLFFIKTNVKKVLIILLIVTVIPILFFKTGIDQVDKFLTLKTYKNIFVKKQPSIPPLPPTPYHLNPNVSESFDIRKIVWEGAWKLALRYPLFGTGVETFAFSYNFVRPVAHNLTSEWDYVYNKAHNEYFNFLATTGFVGLCSYLLLIFIFYFSIFKQFLKFKHLNIGNSLKIKNLKLKIEENRFDKELLAILLTIAYITILITNFFGFSTTTIQLFFFLIPAFIFSTFNPLPPNPYLIIPNRLTNLQKFFIFLLLSSTIYILFSISVYYLADVNYSFGLKYSRINDQQKATEYFEKAVKLRPEPVYIDKFSSSLSYLSAVANIQKQYQLARQIAGLSDAYNKKLIQDSPKNVFYWKTRAKNMYYFYQITSQENELLQGVFALKSAQELAPTDPKIYYSLALYYSMLFDINKDKQYQKLSLEEIDKVIQLKSNYQEAYSLRNELLKKYNLK